MLFANPSYYLQRELVYEKIGRTEIIFNSKIQLQFVVVFFAMLAQTKNIFILKV